MKARKLAGVGQVPVADGGQGAADFLAKPCEHDALRAQIDKALAHRALALRLERMDARITSIESDAQRGMREIIGASPPMQEVFETTGKMAPTESTLPILGESGTGKEVVARAVREGRFREDLYYRMNVFALQLRLLRRCGEDIAALVQASRNRYAERLGTGDGGIAERALAALTGYHWPGNVRELRNGVERALILAQGKTIDLQHLPASAVPAAAEAQAPEDGSRRTARLGLDWLLHGCHSFGLGYSVESDRANLGVNQIGDFEGHEDTQEYEAEADLVKH